MKCIDQMPTPIEIEPKMSQTRLARPWDSATRQAKRSEVKDTITATPIDRHTSHEL